MSSKSQADGIIAVVCEKCGFADQVSETSDLNHLCPVCNVTMISEQISGRKPRSVKRNLKVVPSGTPGKETRAMKKASKGKDRSKDQTLTESEEGTFVELEGVPAEQETMTVSPEDVGSVEEAVSEEESSEPLVPEESPHAERTPFMTQGEVWTTYATVLNCKSPDEIFDVFGRTFEEKGHLAWWNNRVGRNDLYVFYRPRDIVEFFRKCSHEIWSRMKHGTLNPPEKAALAMWTWLLHDRVMKAKSPDDIFDELARQIEWKSDMTGWLYRTNHGDLVALGKGGDLIDYFRRISHKLWTEMHKKA